MNNTMSNLRPINIQVQNISDCSGVFISSSNVMHGWSSHSKSNNGFGSIGASNLVERNVNIVYDPDYLDTPIDDRDNYTLIQNDRTESSDQFIGFDKIVVNSITSNSGIFVGKSNLNGLDRNSKENIGYGSMTGNGSVSLGNQTIVSDEDIIDGVINDQDTKNGAFINK